LIQLSLNVLKNKGDWTQDGNSCSRLDPDYFSLKEVLITAVLKGIFNNTGSSISRQYSIILVGMKSSMQNVGFEAAM
jgi:hypothetical protein